MRSGSRRFWHLLTVTTLVATSSAAGVTAQIEPVSAATGYVGIVISIDGGRDVVRCLPYTGASGDKILNEVASVDYRPRDGIITAINHYPSPAVAFNDYYWVYYHDTGSGWSYSEEGFGSYQPAPGTVEGWRFDNHASVTPVPPNLSFYDICGGTAPTPVPVRAAATVAPMVVPTVPPVAAAPAPVAPPTRAVSATGRSAPSKSSAPPSTAGTGASATVAGGVPSASLTERSVVSDVSAPISSSTVPPSPAGASASRRSSSPFNAADSMKSNAGSVASVVLAILLVAVLGGGAVVAARRRRAS